MQMGNIVKKVTEGCNAAIQSIRPRPDDPFGDWVNDLRNKEKGDDALSLIFEEGPFLFETDTSRELYDFVTNLDKEGSEVNTETSRFLRFITDKYEEGIYRDDITLFELQTLLSFMKLAVQLQNDGLITYSNLSVMFNELDMYLKRDGLGMLNANNIIVAGDSSIKAIAMFSETRQRTKFRTFEKNTADGTLVSKPSKFVEPDWDAIEESLKNYLEVVFEGNGYNEKHNTRETITVFSPHDITAFGGYTTSNTNTTTKSLMRITPVIIRYASLDNVVRYFCGYKYTPLYT